MLLLGKPLDHCKAGVVQDAQYEMAFLKIEYIEKIVHFVHLTPVNLKHFYCSTMMHTIIKSQEY
jgi:hypothetical protein